MAEKDARIAAAVAVGQEWSRLASDFQAKINALTAPKPEPITPDPVAAVSRDLNVISLAIREVAQGDTRLAQYLHARKRELRKEHPHMSDEGIADLLMTFETTEDATRDGAPS